jgi:hypothetical protein
VLLRHSVAVTRTSNVFFLNRWLGSISSLCVTDSVRPGSDVRRCCIGRLLLGHKDGQQGREINIVERPFTDFATAYPDPMRTFVSTLIVIARDGSCTGLVSGDCGSPVPPIWKMTASPAPCQSSQRRMARFALYPRKRDRLSSGLTAMRYRIVASGDDARGAVSDRLRPCSLRHGARRRLG